MGPSRIDGTREARIHANEENLFGLFESLVGFPRVEVVRSAMALRTLSDVPFPLFNSVLGARLSGGAIDATVVGLLAPYVDRGVPMTWWTGPSTRPTDLPKVLERNGLVPVASSPCMSLALDGWQEDVRPIAGFRIERVWNRGLAADWSRAVRVSFGFPSFAIEAYTEAMVHCGFGPDSPFEHWVGYLDGTPVASATLFRCAGVAGIYNVATLPRARGRGIGAAITQAPLREARSEGLGLAVLQASPEGFPIYVKLGFQQDGEVAQHVLRARASGRERRGPV
ncbi:MAG TPA: GNAT family N-acetyltransferase [Myxococcota bacterium]|nr:GNAT family N-acetyltransferase [Myxococcota bacterium]